MLRKTIQSRKTGNLSKRKIIEKRGGRAANFFFALSYLAQGGRLMRISWEEENSYIFLEEGILLHNKPYHRNQKKYLGGYPYVMASDDMYADDWMTI